MAHPIYSQDHECDNVSGHIRRIAGVLTFICALVGTALALFAQNRAQDDVAWAYGFATSGPDPVAPACSAETKPHDCSWPGRPWPDDGISLHLPGSDRAFTLAQIQSSFAHADCFPADHRAAPDIVKSARETDHLRPCAHCHYFNGQGKAKNGHIAVLTVNYIVKQMNLFR